MIDFWLNFVSTITFSSHVRIKLIIQSFWDFSMWEFRWVQLNWRKLMISHEIWDWYGNHRDILHMINLQASKEYASLISEIKF